MQGCEARPRPLTIRIFKVEAKNYEHLQQIEVYDINFVHHHHYFRK